MSLTTRSAATTHALQKVSSSGEKRTLHVQAYAIISGGDLNKKTRRIEGITVKILFGPLGSMISKKRVGCSGAPGESLPTHVATWVESQISEDPKLKALQDYGLDIEGIVTKTWEEHLSKFSVD